MKRKKVMALLAISSSTSMIFLDSTILPVALPTIQKELLISNLSLQWIINAYLLAIASLALAGGRIADIFGHRRLFCIGLLLFAGASTTGGLAQDGGWLIFSRTLQGVGGAFMGPAALSLLMETFSSKERGRALGIMVGFSSLFLSLGPFLGGFLTQYFSWRLVFWVNLPIALAGVFLALISLEKSPKNEDTFDFYGFIALFCGLSSVILFFMQGQTWGWFSPPSLFLLLITFLSALFLPFSERFVKYPFFDLTLFKIPLFISGNLIVFATQFLLMMTVFWAIYFQKNLNYTPVQAGSITLISTLPVIIFAPIAGLLLDRFGPRGPTTAGFLLIIFGFSGFFFFLDYGSIFYLIPSLFSFGAGIPLILTANSTTTISSVPIRKRGAASGIYNTMRYVGATFGVAIIGSIITNIRSMHFSKALEKEGLNVQFSDLLELPIKNLSSYSSATKQLIVNLYKEANLHAYGIATLTAVAIAIIALIISRQAFKNYDRENYD